MTGLSAVRVLLLAVAAIATTPAGLAGQHHHHGPPPEQPPPAEEGELPPFIRPLTEEDRKAAFPDVEGHAVHDRAVNSFVLFDQIEWRSGSGIDIDSTGWIGRDIDRFWFRAEGAGDARRVEHAEAHFLYGRHVARWWDVVAGVRQDFRPGAAQTWAAVGVQGLAPYWFEIEATAYLGGSGRTHVRLEAEYTMLLTNRWMLQPLLEVDVFGKSDPERGIGAGLSSTDAGLRLRYELKRELAPYIGVTWQKKYRRTAALAEGAGEGTSAGRVVAGLRVWF